MPGMSSRPPLPQRLARRLLPFSRSRKQPAPQWPAFAARPDDIQTLDGPAAFRETLLAMIKQAKHRIVLVALYLQDDAAGREVLDALYAAHKANPTLDIEIYVDWHRARRGLIGKAASEGNAAMYRQYAMQYGDAVKVFGVPVQNRELFGVLHLKGFVIDDDVLYSGASINDVYLAKHDRYRLDRYHRIHHAGLSESMVRFAKHHLAESDAVTRLDRRPLPSTRELQTVIRHLRRTLQHAHYTAPHAALKEGDVAVTPLVGFGRSGNQLNDAVLTLLRRAQKRVVIFTPYFNLPRQVRATLGHLLRRGCVIDIVVGDKTANDFYIPPHEPFRKIGLLPYLYENNLRRFARNHRAHMLRGQLNLWLWRDGDNSYHLKGLLIDEEIALLTGNNLNPRAWALDLENGLLLRDPSHRLTAQHEAEWAALRRHAMRLDDYHALDNPRHYPAEVRTLLRRLRRVRLDRLLNRLL
jgi:CDP-diacylglycerol---serine O-phosphatidyltransferase